MCGMIREFQGEGVQVIFILMAYQSLEDSHLAWDEFAGVFDTLDGAKNAVDLDRFAWLESSEGWVTNDCAAGGGVRRSFYIRKATMNSTKRLSGEMKLMGLK